MSRMVRENDDWLRWMADAEDGAVVSVGGWVSTLTRLEAEEIQDGDGPAKTAFLRLLQLTRRERQLTFEQLAREANVDAAELARFEQDAYYLPQPQMVSQLSAYLQIPEERLLALAGHASSTDLRLYEAATRFAAGYVPLPELTTEEHVALKEFVKALSAR